MALEHWCSSGFANTDLDLQLFLGSGCLGSNIAAALVLVVGGGSAGALYALARWLDTSAARVPLLMVSTLIASIVLAARGESRE